MIEQIRAVAEELRSLDPDASSDLHEYAERIEEAWVNPSAVGTLTDAAWTVSEYMAKVYAIMGKHGK
ncbi:hypothetical protein GTY75_05170 [Streptomyces sp. SID8381]|uniref:hypothetical protein n=1 Tax=unclassified Streptomyces TaxID=2593676 RepID=UPI00035F84AB|nr:MULTISPECIES: hypothetical protein [unclassified Streptomyces]MYX26064.1 hypothetical protein [Streptomyces sp. SID8381]